MDFGGLIILIVLVVFGPSLFFLVRGTTGILRDRTFAAVAQRVPGKVTGNKWRLRPNLGSSWWRGLDYSKLEFATLDGAPVQTISRAPHQAEPGTEVEVEYDPSNPASARPVDAGSHRYGWDVFGGLLGIAVGVFIFFQL